MNNRRKFVVAALGVIAVLLIAAGAIVQTIRASEDDRTRKLYGSWNVAVVSQQLGPFPGLLTFTADGGVIGDPPPQGVVQTTSHGNWVPRSHTEVAYTLVGLFAANNQVELKLTGSLKIVGTLQYDAGKDSWYGPYKLNIYDASGHVISTDTGTFRLTRIAVESLH